MKKIVENPYSNPSLYHRSKEAHKEKPQNLGGMRVLVVEDNMINLKFASTLLKKWNCTYSIAYDGYDAIQLLEKDTFELILMDIQMPNMDGLEATHFIRSYMKASVKNIPIVALTGNVVTGDREKCINAGMNDYIPKPYKPHDLFEVLLKYNMKNTNFSHGNSSINQRQTSNQMAKLTDLTYLATVCDNDPDFMRDMMETFLEDTPGMIKQLREKLEEKDWENLGKIAHKIKPSITFMGIESLVGKVKEIEMNGKKAENIENLPSMIDELASTCDQAYSELRKRLDNNDFGV